MIQPFEDILNQNVSQLSKYLEYGDVNIQDEKGRSLLCYAIQLHRNEIVKLLIKNYIDLGLTDYEGNNCYHYAVYHNRLGYLKMLLKMDGNPMKRNNSGQTPLYLACLYGRKTSIDLFLERFTLHIEEVDEYNETILMALVRSGELDLLKRFFSSSLLEHQNVFGDTALMVAVRLNHFDIASFLLENGAFIHHRNLNRETSIFDAVRNNNREMVILLTSFGASLELLNREMISIDMIASSSMKELLIELRSRDRICNYSKRYPLHNAILLGDKVSFSNYLKFQFVNLMDSYGFTPFQLAEKLNEKEMLDSIERIIKEVHIIELKQKK